MLAPLKVPASFVGIKAGMLVPEQTTWPTIGDMAIVGNTVILKSRGIPMQDSAPFT